jgi:hypothetical protein
MNTGQYGQSSSSAVAAAAASGAYSSDSNGASSPPPEVNFNSKLFITRAILKFEKEMRS